MDLDRFDPNNDIDEDDNSRDHSTSNHIESIENTHNQNWIDIKAMWNGLSNSQLSSKIESKLIGSDSESVSLNEIQRKLRSLELEEEKYDQKHAAQIYPFIQRNFIEDTEFAVARRNKKKRLSLDEKILVYKTVKFQKQRAIDVARKFGVSI